MSRSWHFDVQQLGFGNSYRLVVDGKELHSPAAKHVTSVEVLYAKDGYIQFRDNVV